MAAQPLDGQQVEPLVRLLVAALGGMLIGLEREKARAQAARSRRRRPGLEEMVVKEFPGLRTFTLVSVYASLLGYLWSAGLLSTVLAAVLLAAFASVIVVFATYRLMVARMAGITTVVVMLVDFLVGLASGLGQVLVASSTAVLTAFLLAIKLPAEEIVGRIRYEELLWALELGVVLIVVGPFFLSSTVSLYGVSLRSIYLFFALVLSTSYLGYVLARLRGGRGIAYTAFFGGLANSEATLAAVVRLLGSKARGLAYDLSVIVNSAMVVRNLAIAAVLLAPAGPAALAWLAVALAASLVPAPLSWRRSLRVLTGVDVEIENPLSYGSAAKATLIYLAVSLLVYATRGHAGGLYLAAALGGFVSSSATIVAVASQGLPPSAAATASVVATAAGLLNKPFYAYMGSRDAATAAKAAVAGLIQASLMAGASAVLGYVYPNLWKTAA